MEARSLLELATENAALNATVLQQKQRIEFLERTVTQMIHTAYNADVPRGTHDDALHRICEELRNSPPKKES